jgi:hypothetical protein
MEQENMAAEQADDKEKNSPAEIDWENRRLCSDGNCIGVVGPDGRCKECGQKAEDFSGEEADVEKDRLSEAEVPEEQVSFEAETDEFPPDTDWKSRRLCSDDNCIGVIGPDGRCKECGKPYEE